MSLQKPTPEEVKQIIRWGQLDAECQRASTLPNRREELLRECNAIARDLDDTDPLGRQDRMRALLTRVQGTPV